MNTRKAAVVAVGITALGVLVVSSNSVASSKEPAPEELSVVVGAPLSDDNIPGANRTPAVEYADNPHVGDAFDPVEDEYGNLVYPTPVVVEPGR